MYQSPQKKSSSWTVTSIQKKSKSFSKPGSSAVQASRDANSAQSQDMPSYSTAGGDFLAGSIMRSVETEEPSEVEMSTGKRQSEPGRAAVAATAPPIVSIPVVQPNSVGIQRQCSECASQQQQQSGEEGKDVLEMSEAASGIQTKLTRGAPGDAYEQEADRVAAQVMSMPIAAAAGPKVQRFGEEPSSVGMYSSLARSITPVVQRRVDEQVQMRSLVQRAFQAGGNQASGDLESRLNASRGGGSALAPEVRAFMEPRFGADFSSVRVHTGGEAVQMNRELGAQAFAHGSDVYFGAGKSPGNNELTAHELTHVVQQTGATNSPIQRQCGVDESCMEEPNASYSEPNYTPATPEPNASYPNEGGAEGGPNAPSPSQEPSQEPSDEESWWDRGIDWVENKVASGAHQLADKADGIPVLEQVADAGAWIVDQQTQLNGGILKGAGTMVGGIANMIVHPVDTVMGLEAMAEHAPMLPGVPNPLKAAHGLYDIAVNGKDVGEVANHVLNPIQSLQDDFEFGKKMVGGITKPYQQAIKQGKYSEAIGRGIFDIGSLFLGAGAGAGVKGAAGAGRGAAIAGEVADTARVAKGAAVASDAAKVAKGADAASDATKVAKGAAVASDAAAGPINFMSNQDKFLKNASKRADIDPGGTIDVVAHGSTQKIEVITPKGSVLVDHRVASKLIRNNPGYKGQPIRMLSCSTGACDTGFAQNLANKMGVPVEAPTDLVWAYSDGSMVVAPRRSLDPKSPLFNSPDLTKQGTFRTFMPKKSP